MGEYDENVTAEDPGSEGLAEELGSDSEVAPTEPTSTGEGDAEADGASEPE